MSDLQFEIMTYRRDIQSAVARYALEVSGNEGSRHIRAAAGNRNPLPAMRERERELEALKFIMALVKEGFDVVAALAAKTPTDNSDTEVTA